MATWAAEQRPVAQIVQISAEELKQWNGPIQIVDVRRQPEWASGLIPGARLMPLHSLDSTTGELDRSVPVAVHCKGGYRSSIACSLLQRAGFDQVMNLIGGFDAWRACGLPEA
jgi:rhodanese-related sulfurtransferase